jgi:hypothetical protein
MKHRRRNLKIPGDADWAGYESDLDVRHAHKLLFGKTLTEVQRHFGGAKSIERADELLHMPRRALQYYIFAFAEFVVSDAAEEDPDSASSFLRFLIARERRDPGSVADVYQRLRPYVTHVATSQVRYDADFNIYGSFLDLAAELDSVCSAKNT